MELIFNPIADAVTVDEIVDTRFGEKAVLEGATYDAKEAIKSLDWDETHRTFDDHIKAWTIDADALDALEAALEENGFSLVRDDWIDGMIAEIREHVEVDGWSMWESHGVQIEVDYEAKKSDKPMSKAGVIVAADDGMLYFERDDGRTNRLMGDGIYSSGHYPFMGTVTEVRVEIPGADAEQAEAEAEA